MVGEASSETLTFVFADLESSTRLWERLPDAIVYETFTEGFDTPDLAEARAVLDEVGARVT
jgi:class 3 adenylate cyclase